MAIKQAHPDYKGQVAIVTGADSGIGVALTCALLDRGVNVLATYRSESAGKRLKEAIRQQERPGRAECVVADTTQEQDVRRAVDTAVERFGALDIAFNNASDAGPSGPLDNTDMHSLTAAIDMSLVSTIHGMREQLRVMRPRKSGLIVNVSSVYGSRGAMTRPAHSACMHAVIGLTRSAAITEAPNGIRVISVSPGEVDTPKLRTALGKHYDTLAARTPLGYYPLPEDVAHDIVALANPTVRLINGADVKIDGAAHAF